MNDREKEILAILRRNPLLIQQNEIADMLQISRSRVAAHILDLMRKGRDVKGKGYILTEQESLRGGGDNQYGYSRDGGYPLPASKPSTFQVHVRCSAERRGTRHIAHNLALLRPGRAFAFS